MSLLKTSFFTGISTVIRIATSFVINKIVAIYIGPSGLAVIGQFQNFATLVMTLANGAINGVVIKYTSEYREQPDQKARIFSSALIISLVCSLLISTGLIVFHKELSISFLKDVKYSSIFFIFGLTLVIFSINSLFVSILNGHKEIKKFVSLNIASSITGLIFTSLLIIHLGLYGALLSYVTTQTIVFFLTVFFVINSEWFKLGDFFRGYNLESFAKLGKYSLMAIISAILVPTAQILVRTYIVDNLSMDSAGYWQGVWKISEVYLLVITTSLSVYYLPRLAEIKDPQELRKEIFSGYKIIMPIVIILALMIFLFRNIIIVLLFTDEFLPMANLFTFQLIGDVIKIFAWLLSYIMVAKSMTKYFIVTEVLGAVSLVTLVKIFIDNFGLIGATQAFALNYFIYALVMIWIFRDLIFGKAVKYAE